ncbi:MAG: cytochrome c1 [Pseudomonadota bacterium]
MKNTDYTENKMLRKSLFSAALLAIFGFTGFANANENVTLKEVNFAYKGMTGYVDKASAQRGFQIYNQICSNCHSMKLVAYRSLADIGFKEDEIKSIAASKQVEDIDDNTGQSRMRNGKPFDAFIAPFANEAASRAANNGAYPPDLSLIVKARKGGGDYVYSLLTGFDDAPAEETPVANKYYNHFFPGHWISMPPPLSDGSVTYQDGTRASIDQMARDVVTFLQWAAEPEMQARKQMGLKVLIFLSILTTFLYIIKRRIWKNVKH